MSNKKISELTTVTLPITGNELIPIVQSGETKKIEVSNLASKKISLSPNELHTGFTGYQTKHEIVIPPNTIQDGDVWEIDILASKTGVNFSSTCSLYASITGETASIGFIRNVNIGNSSGSQARVVKSLFFVDNQVFRHSNSGGFYTDLNSISPYGGLAFDRTVENRIYIGLNPTSLTGEVVMRFIIFRKIN